MELFFTDDKFKISGTPFKGVPFFVDSQYRLLDEINEFFVHELITLSVQTWKSYAYSLLDFLKWAEVNGLNWRLITHQDLVAYRNWSRGDCKLKPATVNSRITVLKRFFEYAVTSEVIKKNPITSKTSMRVAADDSDFLSHTHRFHYESNDITFRETSELPKYFSDQDLLEIGLAKKSFRLALMIMIMLDCGLRRSEVSKLPDSLVEKSIKEARKKGPGSQILLDMPAEICKGNKARSVPLSYFVLIQLMHYRNTVRPQYVKKYRAKHNKNPIGFWITQMGSEYQPTTLSMEIADLGKNIGIEANPHKFRHTFATNYYSKTKDLRMLQKILGHSNIQTTTIYEHTAVEDHSGVLSQYHKYIEEITHD